MKHFSRGVICLLIAIALFTDLVESRRKRFFGSRPSLRNRNRFRPGKNRPKAVETDPALLLRVQSKRISENLSRTISLLQKVIDQIIQSLGDTPQDPPNLESELIDLEGSGLTGLVGVFRDSILAILNNELQSLISTQATLLKNLPFCGQLVAGATTNDYSDSCSTWKKDDVLLPDITKNISLCPCTMLEALADTDHFINDEGCSFGNLCIFHPGAFHCVVSKQPSVTGGGQQCCYNDLGNILGADELGAGSSDRTSKLVDGVGHVLDDVAPFIYCCLWSDNCSIYQELRPSENTCPTPSPNEI